MRRYLALLSAVAVVVGGGFAAGAALSGPRAAVAHEAAIDDADTSSTHESTGSPEIDGIDEILSDLVEEGTLTQEQANAVEEAFRDRVPFHLGRGHQGFGHGHGGFGGFYGKQLDVAAAAIGIEVADLMDALREGQSIANVANDRGVDPADVIEALIAEKNAMIDEALADDKITEHQAKGLRDHTAERVEAFVRREFSFGPKRFRGHGFHRFGHGDSASTGQSTVSSA